MASTDGDTTKVWDAETAQELLSIDDGDGKASFSPDGTRLITPSTVWDAETGKKLISLPVVNSSGMTVSPDGKRLANTAPRQPVRVYDAETGQQLFFFNGPAGGVTDVAFSPDSKRLALVGTNGVVEIWDATTSPEARLLGGGAAWVHSLSYSPDGKQLAAGCLDKAVRVFDVKTGEVILTLRRILWGRQPRRSLARMAGGWPLLRAMASRSKFGTSKRGRNW